MKKNNIEPIRSHLKSIADARYAANPIFLYGAYEAIDIYCDAKIAYHELMAGTITSYSIQGRSISKRDIGNFPWDSLVEDLLNYFTQEEIPDSPKGNLAINVDFSKGAY